MKFAFQSGDIASPKDFIRNIGKAVEAGLDKETADLVLTDGDLLELRTQVKKLLIAGREVTLETRHTHLYRQYLARP